MTKSLHTTAYQNFVASLVAARRDQGLTQQEVADRIGKPQSYLAKIEGCERRLDVVEFIDLAHALEVDPAAFFARILEKTSHAN